MFFALYLAPVSARVIAGVPKVDRLSGCSIARRNIMLLCNPTFIVLRCFNLLERRIYTTDQEFPMLLHQTLHFGPIRKTCSPDNS